MSIVRRCLVLLAVLALPACDAQPAADDALPPDTAAAPVAPPAQPAAPPSQSGTDSVALVFRRGEEPVTVWRRVDRAPDVALALQNLLAGPDAAERAAGIESWFSDATRGALVSATVDRAGRATIDFANLRSMIPNASSSAGSAALLAELNGTVFEFAEVRSIEYRMDGSCDAFWEWLQYGCRTETR
jgi:hypothetical protein